MLNRLMKMNNQIALAARIQMGLQLCQVKPCVHGSCVPEKAGELVAAINLSLACFQSLSTECKGA